MCFSQNDNVGVLGQGNGFEGEPFGQGKSINVEEQGAEGDRRWYDPCVSGVRRGWSCHGVWWWFWSCFPDPIWSVIPSFRGFGHGKGGGDCRQGEWVVTQLVSSGRGSREGN